MTTTTQEKVEFIQYDQPSLESGEYTIKIEQQISGEGITDTTYTRQVTIAVTGERFGPVSPDEIENRFPPADTLGEHSNILPHITLSRSSLPWERYPDKGAGDENLSWLILLVFRESEFAEKSDMPRPQSLSLQELIDSSEGSTDVKFPALTPDDLEVDQKVGDRTTVIDVKKKYLVPILPTKAEIEYLNHVRQTKNAEGAPKGDDHATIFANRLPQASGASIVHLVSIEGRYTAEGTFDFMGAGDDELIRLVTLDNWRFTSVDPEQSFTGLLQNLNRTQSFPRLADSGDANADAYLAKGYLPLPHALREGSKTVSWYRSPLIPGDNPEDFEPLLPAIAADQLTRYDSALGLFDSSYAAAWQLGRMLMLENERLAVDLFNWKRENAHALNELHDSIIDLPVRSRSLRNGEPIPIPENLSEWFQDLEVLRQIPFNYLIPDERLLPPESVRFFWVDSQWVDCLQDGAFSIGRVTQTDLEEDQATRSSSRFTRSNDQQISGIVMRSQVVSGWPHLLVDGYDEILDTIEEPEDKLRLLRMEKLSKDVLICLFEGEIKTVDMHLKTESMQFGLDPAEEDETYPTEKGLRDPETGVEGFDTITVPWKAEPESGIIDIVGMAEEMKEILGGTFTAAQFAMQMIEGAPKVRFPRSADS